MKPCKQKFWAVQWRSHNLLDGKTEHLQGDCSVMPGPRLFETRHAARMWRDALFGYIRTRPDLKREPHGWKLPRVVQVTVTYSVTPPPPPRERKTEGER